MSDKGGMAIFPRALILMLALLSTRVEAQSQAAVPVFTGEVTATNSQQFNTALANRVDAIVGVKVTVDPTDDRSPAGYLVDQLDENGGVYISQVDREGSGIQINAPSAFWRHGSYVIDGFFVVKYGGMGQGIMGYQLKPVDEATVLLSPVERQTVGLDHLVLERRAFVAD